MKNILVFSGLALIGGIVLFSIENAVKEAISLEFGGNQDSESEEFKFV